MWQPKRIGQVIAERRLDFEREDGRVQRVTLKVGLPVHPPGAKCSDGDPYWCPVQVRGAGLDIFCPIAGEDALQALILALAYLGDVLPSEARRLGGQISWLGDSERVILGTHALSRAAASTLIAGSTSTATSLTSRRTFTSITTISRRNSGSLLWLWRNFGFRAKELADLDRMVQDNRETFLKAWHEYFGS